MDTLLKAAMVACCFAVFTTRASAVESLNESKGEPPGMALFKNHCAMCHERDSQAPTVVKLTLMAPNAIYNVLTRGVMRTEAFGLSPEEVRQITQYLTGRNPWDAEAALFMCKHDTNWLDPETTPVGSGWGITPDNDRSISAREAGLSATEVHKLKPLWSFTYPGAFMSRSQPAIVGKALFVGSSSGAVYAMDARSGCVHWKFEAVSQIRGSVVYRRRLVERDDGVVGGPTLFFADLLQVYAVDARTGSLRWKTKVEDDPSAVVGATPVVSRERLYVPISGVQEEAGAAAYEDYVCCTFRGSIITLDRRTGALIWKRYTIPTVATEQYRNSLGKPHLGPSGAGVWGSPVLDEKRGSVYFATGNNYSDGSDDNSDAVFSVDARTGDVKWKTQTQRGDAFNDGCVGRRIATCPKKHGPDADFTAPPVLVHGSGGKDILVAGQKNGAVFGFNPETGAILWRAHIGQESNSNPLAVSFWFGMAVQNNRLIIPTVSSTPVDSPGSRGWLPSPFNGLYALNPFTGKLVWSAPVVGYCEKPTPCGGVQMAPLAIPDAVFAGSVDGYIRTYATQSGKVLWRFNTGKLFTDQRGARGSGGSVSGAGQIMIANGMVYVNSYDPGEKSRAVLLAFGVKSNSQTQRQNRQLRQGIDEIQQHPRRRSPLS